MQKKDLVLHQLVKLEVAAFLSHNLRKRSQKMKRQARGTMILNQSDAKIVKQFIPYA